MWLVVLLQAASVAFAQKIPKPIYPPGPYTIEFLYDTLGRVSRVVDGATVLGEYAYDGNSVVPVAYTALNGNVRWITDEDRVVILAFSTAVTDTMTQADADKLVASMNDYWKTADWRTTNQYPAPPETRNQCIAKCEDRWMKTGMAVCALLARRNLVWGAECAAAMLVGYGACRAACPDQPHGPWELVWCRSWPTQGAPNMSTHPERCGPDPDILVNQGCTQQGFGILPDPISSQNGGYRRFAQCWYYPTNRPREHAQDSWADLWMICRPDYARNVAEAWWQYGNITFDLMSLYLCGP